MFGPSNDDIPASELRHAAALARQADIIQRRNARFAALTPERKRMTLARDVIKWLIGGKLRPAGLGGRQHVPERLRRAAAARQ